MVEKEVDEVCVDEKNRLVSTPAFMYDGKFHQIQVRKCFLLNQRLIFQDFFLRLSRTACPRWSEPW